MPVYLLTYDLMKEVGSADYKALRDALQRDGAHKTQLSAWLISSSLGAKALHNRFKPLLDDNDRLWVTRVRPHEHTFSNAIAGTKRWLEEHPPS